jgi:hypothetical protein
MDFCITPVIVLCSYSTVLLWLQIDCYTLGKAKGMEKNGLITRKVYDETPLKVEYFLTEKGLAMKPILDQMAAFFPWNTVRKTRLKMESQEACRMFIINCL